eukprot:scaffold63483_cov69-Phaeocystis_antarctica.AAC.1
MKAMLNPTRWFHRTACFRTRRLKRRKETRMASSAMPRSVAGLIPACSAPMRFAGIMRLYSRLAMHHEYTMACRIDQCSNLR